MVLRHPDCVAAVVILGHARPHVRLCVSVAEDGGSVQLELEPVQFIWLEGSCDDSQHGQRKLIALLSAIASDAPVATSVSAARTLARQPPLPAELLTRYGPGWYLLPHGVWKGVRVRELPTSRAECPSVFEVVPLPDGHPASRPGTLARGVVATCDIPDAGSQHPGRWRVLTTHTNGGALVGSTDSIPRFLCDYVHQTDIKGVKFIGNPLGGATALGPLINDDIGTGRAANTAMHCVGRYDQTGKLVELAGVYLDRMPPTFAPIRAGDELVSPP
jgi:hypothetical protein